MTRKKDLELVSTLSLCVSTYFQKYSLLEIYYLTNADAVTQSGFGVIRKIAFTNLEYDVIVIPFFNLRFEWKKLKKKENWEKMNFLVETESIFSYPR